MTTQTALGRPTPYPYPRFDHVAIAIVTSNVDYDTLGRVEVLFMNDGGLAGGVAVPVYVVESGLSVKPEEGDTVLVGFVQGNKDNPWLIGTFKGKAATSGMIALTKEGLTIGVKTNLGAITDLESYVSALYSQIVTLNGQVTDLTTRVEALEAIAHSH
jgi:uncharacterized protein involved in type VI secretion and phage assembly